MAIVPRWEWRTFGAGSFGRCEDDIRAAGLNSNKKTDELYILSKKSDENVKIRFDVVDVKSLQKVNDDKLEQWLPVLKTGFPIKAESLKELFRILKADAPDFKRVEYTYEQFLDEVIKPCSDLEVVKVRKNRDIYKVDGATVEIAETKFNDHPLRTICVEHEDPKLVISIVEKLGLKGAPNVNYIQAMKKSVEMK